MNNLIKNKIIISGEKNQIIDDIFSEKKTKIFNLNENSDLKYLLISNDSDIELNFETKGENSNLDVYGIFLSKTNESIKININVNLNHSNSKSNVYLLNLVDKGSNSAIECVINMAKNIKTVSGHLLKENIILGENIYLKTLPVLNINSNDVSASHGSKVHKLNKNNLFYMMSKGLSLDSSKRLMVEGYIKNVISNFEIKDNGDKILKYSLSYLF